MTGRLFLQKGGGAGQDGEFVQVDVSDLSGSFAAFPSGTVMLFQQTAAPTGWTKITTYNDVGLRVVSGTAGAVTTNTAFSTVFSQSATGGHSLSIAELAAHTHSALVTGSTVVPAIPCANQLTTGNTGSTGSGTAHTHTIALQLNYVDLILASKN